MHPHPILALRLPPAINLDFISTFQYKLSMDATWISTSEQRELMWIYIDSLTSGAQYDVRVIAKNGNTLTEVRQSCASVWACACVTVGN